MAHDANTEDYRRLALRYVTETDTNPSEAMAGYSRFWRDFSGNRDALPQTDADRAFHLVALATDVLDYRLPFATDAQVDDLLSRGRNYLDEALTLDPNCFDARRMRFAMDSPSFDERLAFLTESKDEVRRICLDAATEMHDDQNEERSELAARLATAPYLRWLAALADHALVCGHNHACLNYCLELLKLDPTDISDVRYTLALCYAKMEDYESFERMGDLIGPGLGPVVLDDAWSLIAALALAYKRHGGVRKSLRCLEEILAVYPTAPAVLMRQAELPDGLFARVHVTPYSEDELALALSEATVLTQEGAEEYHQGPFGLWIIDQLTLMKQRNPLPSNPPKKRGGAR